MTFRILDETEPAVQDVRNALCLLVACGTPTPEDVAMIRRRLESAVAKLDREKAPHGGEMYDEGLPPYGMDRVE